MSLVIVMPVIAQLLMCLLKLTHTRVSPPALLSALLHDRVSSQGNRSCEYAASTSAPIIVSHHSFDACGPMRRRPASAA